MFVTLLAVIQRTISRSSCVAAPNQGTFGWSPYIGASLQEQERLSETLHAQHGFVMICIFERVMRKANTWRVREQVIQGVFESSSAEPHAR
jgi:hypothetical protein